LESVRAVSEGTSRSELKRDERLVSGAPVSKHPPRRAPRRAPLEGGAVRLEPLEPARHAADLFRAGHDGGAARSLWTHMPYGPFDDSRTFSKWLQACAVFEDPLFFAVREKAASGAAGMASYLNIRPGDGVLEVGHIWFAPALQRTRAATEALYLLIREAFDELGCRRLEWKCDALNAASRAAALRLGFRFEGIFYRHMIVKGCNRDTAWYSILGEEWPRLRGGFERWLAADNFGDAGRQRLSLRDLNAAA
jgi:RimJ/RimL family protein N-acetyltransferase